MPERRGRREGGAGVGAGSSITAMHVHVSMYMYIHVCLSNYNQPPRRLIIIGYKVPLYNSTPALGPLL